MKKCLRKRRPTKRSAPSSWAGWGPTSSAESSACPTSASPPSSTSSPRPRWRPPKTSPSAPSTPMKVRTGRHHDELPLRSVHLGPVSAFVLINQVLVESMWQYRKLKLPRVTFYHHLHEWGHFRPNYSDQNVQLDPKTPRPKK